MICLFHALSAGKYANFYPINGTFQNFNPVRRFLAGQKPVKDFFDYLGLGHLYVGSLFTIIFGGSYKASLIAFSFLSIFSTGMIALMLGCCIFNDKKIVLAVTNIFLLLMIFKSSIYSNFLVGTEEIKNAIEYSTFVGNSARFIRGLIVPLVILWEKIIVKFLQVAVQNKRINVGIQKKLDIISMAFISGLAFIWSNDYGICCWISIFIMQLVICFSKSRHLGQTIKISAIYLFLSLFAIFICASIFTFGNFTSWLRLTFGTGNYQRWYYNGIKAFYSNYLV